MNRSTAGFKKQRGTALIMAIVLSVLVALIVTSAALMTGISQIDARSKGNSEAALLLAEAGINAELNKVSTAVQASTTNWDTPTSKGSGSLGGVPGTFAIWTSADPNGATYDGTDVWGGSGNFWITSTATVGGATETVYVLAAVTVTPTDAFTIAGLFAVDNQSSGSVYAINIGNKLLATVSGSVAVNGGFTYHDLGNDSCNFTSGANYGVVAGLNDTVNFNNPSAPITSYPNALTFPTVTSIINGIISATSGMTAANTWSWMNSNLPTQEKSTIYTWSGASTTLSTSSSTKAYTTSTPSTTFGSGIWTNANVLNNDPNTGNKVIILQPGDYYFTTVDLTTASKELIIDNAGLTMAGGNPSKKQVRIWIYGSGTGDSSQISIPITFTAPSDPSTFRIYYANSQGTLQFSGTTSVVGAFYVYAGTPSSTNWAALDFTGTFTMTGSIIVDQLMGNNASMNLTYANPSNSSDPTIIFYSTAVSGGYYDGGNFGG